MGSTNYVIYRHGSNRANQSGDVEPVGIQRAQNGAAACEKMAERLNGGGDMIYANQHLRWRAESRASEADWYLAVENEALGGY